MSIEALIKVYLRDLEKLIVEVESYTSEEDLWIKSDGISNSGGNLVLHLIGNLNHFIGAILGDTGYKRQRDLEFSDTGVPKKELVYAINETMGVIKKTLSTIPESQLTEKYAQKIGDIEYTTDVLLFHLLSHLAYHSGQINYHRRLLINQK